MCSLFVTSAADVGNGTLVGRLGLRCSSLLAALIALASAPLASLRIRFGSGGGACSNTKKHTAHQPGINMMQLAGTPRHACTCAPAPVQSCEIHAWDVPAAASEGLASGRVETT